jgi:hypothetical protein
MLNNFFSDSCAVYEIMWESALERRNHTWQYKLQRGATTLHAGCLKGTNTHWDYVVLTALPWQQWLHERTSCYIICTLSVLLNFILLCSNSNLHFYYKPNVSWVPCTSIYAKIHPSMMSPTPTIHAFFFVNILPSISSKRNSDYKTHVSQNNCLTIKLITSFIPYLTKFNITIIC